MLGEDLTTGADRNKQTIFGIPVDEHTLSQNDGVAAWPCITAIAESPVKAGVLWVGTDDGYVQMSRDGGKSWTNVSSHFTGMAKGGYVSRIEPSYKDAATAYITFEQSPQRGLRDLHFRDEELRRFVFEADEWNSAKRGHGSRGPRGSRQS